MFLKGTVFRNYYLHYREKQFDPKLADPKKKIYHPAIFLSRFSFSSPLLYLIQFSLYAPTPIHLYLSPIHLCHFCLFLLLLIFFIHLLFKSFLDLSSQHQFCALRLLIQVFITPAHCFTLYFLPATYSKSPSLIRVIETRWTLCCAMQDCISCWQALWLNTDNRKKKRQIRCKMKEHRLRVRKNWYEWWRNTWQ